MNAAGIGVLQADNESRQIGGSRPQSSGRHLGINKPATRYDFRRFARFVPRSSECRTTRRQGLFKSTRSHPERDQDPGAHEIRKGLPGRIDKQLLHDRVTAARIPPLAAWRLIDADSFRIRWFLA